MHYVADAQQWAQGLGELAWRITRHIRRREVGSRIADYLQALCAPIERKNGWQIAEAVRDANPYGVQHLLGRAKWDADAVRDDLQRYAVEHFGDEDGVFVLDETGFLKNGKKSAGVQRQYSGTAGRIQNCQNGVFLGYTTKQGSVLIDRALYLPQSWTSDRERCHAAGIPDEVPFRTKPQIGLELIARAVSARIPMRWVVADSVYGGDSGIRLWLQEHKIGYVLAVTGQQSVWSEHGFCRMGKYVAELPESNWRRLSAGDGSKGPRLYDWFFKPIVILDEGWGRAMLARRSISQPKEIAYYLVHMPLTAKVEEIIRVAGSRWSIESLFEAAKNEVGLDQYEVRSWNGWHRHMTLSMFAYAYLATIRKNANEEKKRREQQRDAALYRPRSTPLDLEADLELRVGSSSGFVLVGLASCPPIPRATSPLASTAPTSN